MITYEWHEVSTAKKVLRRMDTNNIWRSRIVAIVRNAVTWWQLDVSGHNTMHFKTEEEAMAMAVALVRLD